MRRGASIAIAIAFLLSVTAAVADTMPENPWHPPKEGVVRDQRAAIAIAHAIWLSMNPEGNTETQDEAVWQSMMKATLRHGIWEVVEKKEEGLVFDIARRDGRIVDIYVVQ
jgi:hypothetical protein